LKAIGTKHVPVLTSLDQELFTAMES